MQCRIYQYMLSTGLFFLAYFGQTVDAKIIEETGNMPSGPSNSEGTVGPNEPIYSTSMAPPFAFGGYIGGGYSLFEPQYDIEQRSGLQNFPSADIKNAAKVSAPKGSFNMFAGLDVMINGKFLVRIEGAYQTSKNVIAELLNPLEQQNRISISNNWKVGTRFGVQVYENVIPYILLGAHFAKFEAKASSGASNVPTYTKMFRKVAFMPGLGIEIRPLKHMMIRLQGEASFFSKMIANSPNNTGAAGYDHMSFRPRTMNISLNVGVRF